MRSSRGRPIAAWSAVMGLAVIAAAAFVFKGVLLVPYHLWRLDSSEASARLEAAESLGRLRSVRAVPRLVGLLREERAQVYEDALEAIGPGAVPGLLQAISQEQSPWDSRTHAVLSRVAPHAIRELGKEVQHGQPPDTPKSTARQWATRFLGALDPPDPRAEPFLLHALGDDSVAVRSDAAFTIDRFALGPEALGPLRRALTRPDQEIVSREHCAAALAKLGEAAFPVLAEASRDPAADVRRAAVRSLRLLVPPLRESALPILITALKDADHHVRSTAAESLGMFGRYAAGALPDLVNLLEDQRASVLSAVLMALEKIGPPEAALPGLIRILSSEGEAQYVRDYAVNVLGGMGARALPAAAALEAALTDPNDEVRRLAARALDQIGAGEGKESP